MGTLTCALILVRAMHTKGETDTDESHAQLLTPKWETVLHPVSTESRTHGDCFHWLTSVHQGFHFTWPMWWCGVDRKNWDCWDFVCWNKINLIPDLLKLLWSSLLFASLQTAELLATQILLSMQSGVLQEAQRFAVNEMKEKTTAVSANQEPGLFCSTLRSSYPRHAYIVTTRPILRSDGQRSRYLSLLFNKLWTAKTVIPRSWLHCTGLNYTHRRRK